jgi:hypothetical protein
MSLGQIAKLSICLIPGGSIRYCHIKLYVVIQDVLWAVWAIGMERRESSPRNLRVEESSRFYLPAGTHFFRLFFALVDRIKSDRKIQKNLEK